MSELRAPFTETSPVEALPATHRPRVGNSEDDYIYRAGYGTVILYIGGTGTMVEVVGYVERQTWRVRFLPRHEFDARFEEIPHP